MISAAWGTVDRERLLAMIMLLRLLNDTLQKPSDNLTDQLLIENSSIPVRVLSLRREKELVEVLAFLASTTGDPSKVVALCVEEILNGTGLIIRMAVNNGGLENVEACFQRIARILQKIANRDHNLLRENESALLREAVNLNLNRILARLNSKHATLYCNFKKVKKRRPQLLLQIADAIAQVSPTRTPSITSEDFAALKSDVEGLRIIFTRLEAVTKEQARAEIGLKLLMEIVRLARQLDSRQILHLAVESLRLDSNTTNKLTMGITKLGRYLTSTILLARAAILLPIFANIQVSVEKLSPTPGILISEPQKFMAEMVNSLFNEKETESASIALEARLGRKGRVELESIVSSTSSTRPVVHAEIQLLFYYELKETVSYPRVICSSKKACFLCNLFMRLHGRFITPSSHGRLYDKWTLPERMKTLQGTRADRIGVIMDRFNDAIQEELRREIRTARKPYPAPYESVVFASAVWTPHRSQNTLQSILSSFKSAPKSEVYCKSGLVMGQSYNMHIGNTTENTSPGLPRNSECSTATSFTDQESSNHTNPLSLTKDTTVLKESTRAVLLHYLPLTRGKVLLQELPSNGEELKVGTPRVHLTLSYDRWKASQVNLPKIEDGAETAIRCLVKIKWLEAGDEQEQGAKTHNINLDAFSKGSAKTLSQGADNFELHMSHGSDVITIEYAFDDHSRVADYGISEIKHLVDATDDKTKEQEPHVRSIKIN